jgi:hypothetical protein
LQQAAKWTDKEIRKLISFIQNFGEQGAVFLSEFADPSLMFKVRTIKYGKLFSVSANSMEALSGTLLTARKHGVWLKDIDDLPSFLIGRDVHWRSFASGST